MLKRREKAVYNVAYRIAQKEQRRRDIDDVITAIKEVVTDEHLLEEIIEKLEEMASELGYNPYQE